MDRIRITDLILGGNAHCTFSVRKMEFNEEMWKQNFFLLFMNYREQAAIIDWPNFHLEGETISGVDLDSIRFL